MHSNNIYALFILIYSNLRTHNNNIYTLFKQTRAKIHSQAL